MLVFFLIRRRAPTSSLFPYTTLFRSVLQALRDSFRHLRHALVALHDATADKPQKMFNRQTTVRGSFIAITGEHLGQAIAYARMNGVVPPWTEGFRAATDQPRP